MRMREPVARKFGERGEKGPVGAFGVPQWRLRHHVDGLVFDLAFALRGANFHAERAAGAVFGRDLESKTEVIHFAPAGLRVFESGRRGGEQFLVINL